MKRITVMLCLLALAGSVFAASPQAGKKELTFAARFVKVKDGGSAYLGTGALAFPLFTSHLVVGPEVTYSNDEFSRSVGVLSELNLAGQASGAFLGATYDYFLKDVAGEDRGAAAARAGFKFGGLGGAFKIYAERTVQGRGKDVADYSGVASLLLRF